MQTLIGTHSKEKVSTLDCKFTETKCARFGVVGGTGFALQLSCVGHFPTWRHNRTGCIRRRPSCQGGSWGRRGQRWARLSPRGRSCGRGRRLWRAAPRGGSGGGRARVGVLFLVIFVLVRVGVVVGEAGPGLVARTAHCNKQRQPPAVSLSPSPPVWRNTRTETRKSERRPVHPGAQKQTVAQEPLERVTTQRHASPVHSLVFVFNTLQAIAGL